MQSCRHGDVRRARDLTTSEQTSPTRLRESRDGRTRAWLRHPMITAPMLEIAVLTLGMVILMIEALPAKIDRRVLVFAAITGLAIVLLASFFVVPSPSPSYVAGFWSFYTADRLSISSSNSRW